jgi:hypothetical protein
LWYIPDEYLNHPITNSRYFAKSYCDHIEIIIQNWRMTKWSLKYGRELVILHPVIESHWILTISHRLTWNSCVVCHPYCFHHWRWYSRSDFISALKPRSDGWMFWYQIVLNNIASGHSCSYFAFSAPRQNIIQVDHCHLSELLSCGTLITSTNSLSVWFIDFICLVFISIYWRNVRSNSDEIVHGKPGNRVRSSQFSRFVSLKQTWIGWCDDIPNRIVTFLLWVFLCHSLKVNVMDIRTTFSAFREYPIESGNSIALIYHQISIWSVWSFSCVLELPRYEDALHALP